LTTSARDLHALEHAAGQLVRVALFETLEADDLGIVVGERGLVAVAVAVEAEHQVLAHGEPRKHRAVLRDDDALGTRAARGDAVDEHAAFVGALEARDDVHQRGLAAAGGPDDGDEFAVGHRERETVDDGQATRVGVGALLDPADVDLSGHSAISLSSGARAGV
jgi:hypothetical protein